MAHHEVDNSVEYDLVIVGGGISGCGAAWYSMQCGLSTLILEATDRVGGKTHTVSDGCGGSGHIELGASWVNDTNQSLVSGLIEELGLERLAQDTTGLYIGQSADGTFYTHGQHDESTKRGDDLEIFLSSLDELAISTSKDDVASSPKAEELDSMSILEWTRKSFPDRPSLPESVDKFVRCVVGADISETSMLYLAHYTACAGGLKCMTGEDEGDAQYQRLVNGTQGISEAIVARLPRETVLLNHPVNSISQAGGMVTVTTKNRQSFRAKKVIFTVTPPLWNSITWSPSLPQRKTIISDNLTMPTYSKIVFAFDKQWWRPKLSGGVIFAQGPIQMIRDTSVPAKNCFTLTCFATGKRGSDWGAQSREKRRRSALEALCSAFVNYVDDILQPVSCREMLWERHEYFGGAPSSSWPPGMLSKGFQKDLKAPHLNVHFAGSETSSHFKGFMEGGLFAARRAVEEIVQSLNRDVHE